jgi:hypothetical protein
MKQRMKKHETTPSLSVPLLRHTRRDLLRMGCGVGAGALFLPWLAGCGGGEASPIEVVLNDIPCPTEENLLIGYMLSTWEFERDGLTLYKIEVLNHRTGETVQCIEQVDLPRIYKGDLGTHFGIRFDHLTRYFFSLRLSIPLGVSAPAEIRHRLAFTNGLAVEGGVLCPRLDERPRVIAPPIRGDRLVFANQSNRVYHFGAALFRDGHIYTTERYAFDSLRYDESLSDFFAGDPAVNSSYFNYGMPVLAVADGTVVQVVNAHPENHGNLGDVVLDSMIDYAGNYVIIDIGEGLFACYAHCIPGSIGVQMGDRVRQGEVIARLGNSGNSNAPHLHFQLCDGPDFFWSRGVPFVLASYVKTGEVPGAIVAPQRVVHSMMEESTVFSL